MNEPQPTPVIADLLFDIIISSLTSLNRVIR